MPIELKVAIILALVILGVYGTYVFIRLMKEGNPAGISSMPSKHLDKETQCKS